MIRVNVAFATKRLSDSFKKLSKAEVAKATSIAINKSLLKGRTEARTQVKRIYNIPQKNLKDINIEKATIRTLSGYVYASRKPIPMDAFQPRFDVVKGGVVKGIQTISKRGISKSQIVKTKARQNGVSIEVKKGDRTSVPYAFLLPGTKPRVFARGKYEPGNGRYGFLQRHTREENNNGNDSVKPLASVTVFAAVINKDAIKRIERVVMQDYERNLMTALRHLSGI